MIKLIWFWSWSIRRKLSDEFQTNVVQPFADKAQLNELPSLSAFWRYFYDFGMCALRVPVDDTTIDIEFNFVVWYAIPKRKKNEIYSIFCQLFGVSYTLPYKQR